MNKEEILYQIVTLEQENKQLKEEIKTYQDMYFDKLVIINKAIEYIHRTEINSIGTPLAYTNIGKQLLEILKDTNDAIKTGDDVIE